MSYSAQSTAWSCGIVLLTLVACADPASPVESRPFEDAVAFLPCSITTAKGTLPNAAECAEVVVPARRDVAGSRTVTLALKRYKQVAEPRGQLWIVAGGPGSAASDLEIDAEFYLGLNPDLELYFLDHRGTGRSARLSCPAEEDPAGQSGELIRNEEWSTCAASLTREWGDDLQGFSTTEAARDLGELIQRTRSDTADVFVYAVSYGTYLMLRYLQLYPTQPTGIILDSICSPGKCDLLLEFDRQFDLTAQRIFGYCAADANCASELGADPWARVKSLTTALATGHCPELGWSPTTLRQVLGFMTTIAGLRDYMPAVVRRLERCADSDVAALQQFQAFVAAIDTESNGYSQALSANIALSELSARPMPSVSDVLANGTGLYASTDEGPHLAPAIAGWPIYGQDASFSSFGRSIVPMLMLNGTLDPQTPLSVAQPTGDYYRSPNQHFVVIPYSPHDTLTQSLVDEDGDTCGAELVRQFLNDPRAPLDLGCLERVLPLRFAGTPTITSLLFGVDTAWSDGLPAPTPNSGTSALAAPFPNWANSAIASLAARTSN